MVINQHKKFPENFASEFDFSILKIWVDESRQQKESFWRSQERPRYIVLERELGCTESDLSVIT